MNEKGVSVIPPDQVNAMLIDHEKRIGSIEKEIPGLVQSVEDLKNIVIAGNNETMNFMKSVIGHEQNMDVIKQQLKQEIQTANLEMKKKQLELEAKTREEKEIWERKQTEAKEKWERDQKAQNLLIIRESIQKMILIGAPVGTAIIAGIVKVIDLYFK